MAGAVLTRAQPRSALPVALALGVLTWRLRVVAEGVQDGPVAFASTS